jgi:hypothetical protein
LVVQELFDCQLFVVSVCEKSVVSFKVFVVESDALQSHVKWDV